MAVLNALRSPAFQAELGLTSSTGSSSPRDSDTGLHMASETGSLSGSMTGSEGHSQDLGMPPPPPPPTPSALHYSIRAVMGLNITVIESQHQECKSEKSIQNKCFDWTSFSWHGLHNLLTNEQQTLEMLYLDCI